MSTLDAGSKMSPAPSPPVVHEQHSNTTDDLALDRPPPNKTCSSSLDPTLAACLATRNRQLQKSIFSQPYCFRHRCHPLSSNPRRLARPLKPTGTYISLTTLSVSQPSCCISSAHHEGHVQGMSDSPTIHLCRLVYLDNVWVECNLAGSCMAARPRTAGVASYWHCVCTKEMRLILPMLFAGSEATKVRTRGRANRFGTFAGFDISNHPPSSQASIVLSPSTPECRG